MAEAIETFPTATEIADIKHPVLRPLADLANASAKFDRSLLAPDFLETELSRLADLQRDEIEFGRVCEAFGLTEINTPQKLAELISRQEARLESLSAEEIFEQLLRLREAVRTGKKLHKRANEAIVMNAALADPELTQLGKLSARNIETMRSSQINVIKDAIKYGYVAEKLPQPHEITREQLPEDADRLRYENGLDPKLLNERTLKKIFEQIQSRNGYQEAVKFAHYSEWLVARALLYSLGKRFADEVGHDAATGKPVIFDLNVETLEDARRSSRKLPPELKSWVVPEGGSAGLMSTSIPDETPETFPPDKLREIAKIVSAPLFQLDQYERLYARYDEVSNLLKRASQRPARRSSAGNTSQLRAEQETLRASIELLSGTIRTAIFSRIKTVFGKCEELLHPDIEKKARDLATYILSPADTEIGSGNPIRKHEGQPLAYSIPLLSKIHRRIAASFN